MEAILLLLEAILHLEEILAPILRVDSFKRNYLLNRIPIILFRSMPLDE
jgi:hypothetical protein